jgi:hypothetical protein
MSATVMNGKPRKQLSDELNRLEAQLDRADQVLDALAEGLNAAVKDAATEGTRLAVKDAVVEILTDPALRAALHQATAPPAKPTAESAWAKVKAKVAAAAARAKAAVGGVVAGAADRAAAVRAGAARACDRARLCWQFRGAVLVAVGVGAAIAAVCYLASHGLAAALSGVGATVTAVVIQAGVLVRRAAKRFTLA